MVLPVFAVTAKGSTDCRIIMGRLPENLPQPQKIADGVLDARWDSESRSIQILKYSDKNDALTISAIEIDSKKMEPIGVIDLKANQIDGRDLANIHLFSKSYPNAVTLIRYAGDKVFLQDLDFQGNALTKIKRLQAGKYLAEKIKYYLNEHSISTFMSTSSWAVATSLADKANIIPENIFSHIGVVALAGASIASGVSMLYQMIKGDLAVNIPKAPQASSIFTHPDIPVKNLSDADLSKFPDISSDRLIRDPLRRYILIANKDSLQLYDLRKNGKPHVWKSAGNLQPFTTDLKGETIFLTDRAGTSWYYLSVKETLGL